MTFFSYQGLHVRLNDEQRLSNRLLSITDRTGVYARPVMNASDALPVSFGISLLKVLNFNIQDNSHATVKLLTRHNYVSTCTVMTLHKSFYFFSWCTEN